jgi:hypothetical protein
MNTDKVIEEFLSICREHAWETLVAAPADRYRFDLALRALTHCAESTPAEDRTTLLQKVSYGLTSPDVYLASLAASVCGTLIAHGANPDVIGTRLLDLVTRQLSLCRDFLELCPEINAADLDELMVVAKKGADLSWIGTLNSASTGAEDPAGNEDAGRSIEAFKAWLGQELAFSAAAESLFRSREVRRAARERHFLLGRLYALAHLSPEAWLLAKLLGEQDDVCLLILDPVAVSGYRVIVECVENNYQVFALLQRCSPSNSQVFTTGGITKFEAKWTFYQWTGLRTANEFASPANLVNIVLGNKRPREIKSFRGEQILVLAPLQFSNSWQGDFQKLHPAHNQSLTVVDHLTGGEAQSVIDRIITSPSPPVE